MSEVAKYDAVIIGSGPAGKIDSAYESGLLQMPPAEVRGTTVHFGHD